MKLPDRIYIADLSGEGDIVWSLEPIERDGVEWTAYVRADRVSGMESDRDAVMRCKGDTV